MPEQPDQHHSPRRQARTRFAARQPSDLSPFGKGHGGRNGYGCRQGPPGHAERLRRLTETVQANLARLNQPATTDPADAPRQPCGVGAFSRRLLRTLRSAGGSTVAELAERLGRTPAVVKAQLARLSNAGRVAATGETRGGQCVWVVAGRASLPAIGQATSA